MVALRKLVGRASIFGLGLITLLTAGTAAAAGNAAAGKAKAGPCMACHGPEGKPAPGLPYPFLAGQNADYITRQLRAFKSGERPSDIMRPQVAGLSDKDMENLGAYFASLEPPAGAARDPELVKKGERIYRGGIAKMGVSACMSCHGPSGHGIPPRFPRVSGQTAAYTEQQLLLFKSGKRHSDGDMMTRIAFRMSEEQIRAVSEYIAGLR